MNAVSEDFKTVLCSDFQKFMSVQTEGICDCNEYCYMEGVCRSYQITNIQIQFVDVSAIANFIWEKSNDTKSKSFHRQNKIRLLFDGVDKRIDIYCLERILTINRIWEAINWDWYHSNGYYGHEIDKIIVNSEIADLINHQVNECEKLVTLKDKVEYLLKLEYGYILDSLQDCNYQIDEVDRDLIFFPQKAHFEKVKKRSSYKNRSKDNIMGLCLFEDGSYRVIDGYNRLSQSKSKSVTIINAFK